MIIDDELNILTFDIEDWYNCDFLSQDFSWDKFEVRIYRGVEKILEELDNKNVKATFFCLGWIAEKHPKVILSILNCGHHIGCHSYQHQLVYRFNPEEFKSDTCRAKNLIEDLIGEAVTSYRAPGFSIGEKNMWAFEVLTELNFQYDSSIFPSNHDYGGYNSYGKCEPVKIETHNGGILKEFPMSYFSFLSKRIVFSGGGFFRAMPYSLIHRMSRLSPYMMTYFHPRDFDPNQPVMETLPPLRKFKSYVGLKTSFKKFQKLISDNEFVTIIQADKHINWDLTRTIKI